MCCAVMCRNVELKCVSALSIDLRLSRSQICYFLTTAYRIPLSGASFRFAGWIQPYVSLSSLSLSLIITPPHILDQVWVVTTYSSTSVSAYSTALCLIQYTLDIGSEITSLTYSLRSFILLIFRACGTLSSPRTISSTEQVCYHTPVSRIDKHLSLSLMFSFVLGCSPATCRVVLPISYQLSPYQQTTFQLVLHFISALIVTYIPIQ